MQIKHIFYDQSHIDTFAEKLEAFLATVSLGGDDEDEEEGETDGMGEEAGEEVEVPPDPNMFIVDPKLVNEAGGGPEDPHPPDTSKMGRFIYKEFESIETLFEYTRSEGYGWDPEIPAVCFAF